MDHTLEVRWFYDGSAPNAVVQWFLDLAPEKQSDRTDLYLLSDDPSLNVKLREGKIQLKRHSGSRSRIQFHDGVAGYREYWQKWSFPLTDEAPDLFDEDPSGLWRPVEKARYQREFDADAQRALLDGALEETAPATALVELTRVTSGPHSAWTICMEAEGDADALPGTLRQMGRYVFQQGTPPALIPSHSHGYVRWLERCYGEAPASAAAAG